MPTGGIQQQIDDAFVANGSQPVVLQPGRYWFTQLRLNQGQVLDGGPNGMFATRLIRTAGATGPAIREKTPTEGGRGAQGISLRNLYVDCGGVAGNGVDLGNQGGPVWGFNGVIENVHVRNAGGDGFALNADAVTGRNLSAYFNEGAGLRTTAHGMSNWFQVSTSRNGYELDLGGCGDNFYGVHIEPGAVESAIIARVGGITLNGVTGFPFGSVQNMVTLTGWANPFTLRDVVYGLNHGHTLTNWIRSDLNPALNTAADGAGNLYLREWHT